MQTVIASIYVTTIVWLYDNMIIIMTISLMVILKNMTHLSLTFFY